VACGRVKSVERVVQFSMEQWCVAMNYVAHCVETMLMATTSTPRQSGCSAPCSGIPGMENGAWWILAPHHLSTTSAGNFLASYNDLWR
jgi:hypothetical protein